MEALAQGCQAFIRVSFEIKRSIARETQRQQPSRWASASSGARIPTLAVSSSKTNPTTTKQTETSECLSFRPWLFVHARSLDSLPWLLLW